MRQNNYVEQIVKHYTGVWTAKPEKQTWGKGPIQDLPESFCILKFPPDKTRNMWTYATCGMSTSDDKDRLELHIFSSKEDESLVELLYAISHYHRNGAYLGVGHTVNFGRPWQPLSKCTYGLISLPYLDGEELEWMDINGMKTRFLWIVPITKEELDYKKKNGLEALEEKFSEMDLNYLNPARDSVI